MLEGTITNTFAGSRRGSKWVYTLDEDGNRIDPDSGEILDDPKKDYAHIDKDGNVISPDEVMR